MNRQNDPRYTECSNDDCTTQVKPAAGHLGGDVLCLDCVEELKDANTIPK